MSQAILQTENISRLMRKFCEKPDVCEGLSLNYWNSQNGSQRDEPHVFSDGTSSGPVIYHIVIVKHCYNHWAITTATIITATTTTTTSTRNISTITTTITTTIATATTTISISTMTTTNTIWLSLPMKYVLFWITYISMKSYFISLQDFRCFTFTPWITLQLNQVH